MKKSIEQIKKFRGTQKSSNDFVNKVYFTDNVIYWGDGTIFYKNIIDFNFNGSYSTDLKGLNDILKSVKTVENINIIDNVMTINNNFKIKLEKDKTALFVDLFNNNNNNLLNKKILSNINIKEFQKFSNASAKYENNVLKDICIKENKLAVTDGNRMNIFELKTENINKDDKEYLLNASLIEKNINKTVDVYTSTDNKYISVVNNNEIITTQSDYELNYPKYEQLIPKYKNNIKINKKEFLNVLKSMKNLINTRTKAVVFDLNNNKIKSIKDNLLNEMPFNFNYNGNLECLSFNIDYLVDACNFMDDDFELYTSDLNDLACILFKKENKTTLLMPIKVDKADYCIEKVENKIVEQEQEQEQENNNKKESEAEIMTINSINGHEHVNAITKHIYTGNNAELLEKAGFNSNEWVGSGQAKKLGKQVKKDAKGVVIKVYKENEDGQTFCKLETIYNIEELEEIKKVENTSQFKDMVNRFKNMFFKTKKRA